MKTLIVDDEKLASSRIQRLLEAQGVEDITVINDPLEAYKQATKTKFDLIFLDISMPELSGLELANKILELEPSSYIVFQTAYEEYAIEAFQAGGLGYLLKPVDEEAIEKTLQKVKSYLEKKTPTSKKLLGKSGGTLYLINLDDIFYIKADLDEVIVRIKQTDVYVRKKIGELDSLLKNKNFFRVHRSYIVNVDKIESMDSVEQSKLEITFKGIDEIVTTSKDGAKEFREYLERNSL
jgi:two-component system LytT family response regulator